MDLTPAVQLGLLLVRPGMVIIMLPGISGNYVPAIGKIGVIVLLAVGLLPSVTVPAAANSVALTVVLAREMAIGLALGFVMQALVAGIEFAGHLSGAQIGLSYGATMNPQSGVKNNMISGLYGTLATLAFLSVNGHHAVLRALAASYTAVPIGAGHISGSLVGSVREVLGMVFVVGIRLAAPIVVVLVVVELVVGIISRTAPTLTSQIVGAPIRIMVGLFVLAGLVGTIPAVTTSLLPSVLVLATRAAGAFR